MHLTDPPKVALPEEEKLPSLSSNRELRTKHMDRTEYFLAPPFWRRLYSAGHLATDCFGTFGLGAELFGPQFRD